MPKLKGKLLLNGALAEYTGSSIRIINQQTQTSSLKLKLQNKEILLQAN